MSLFAISDLHLSLAKNKPMDVFGDNWKDHHIKIKENWLKIISDEDTILIPGDISWAINMVDAKQDLDFINELPGRKILLQGNHDYWWSSVSKLNYAYPEMYFIKNDFTVYEDKAICGTRGWLCPNDTYYTAQDKKIYDRELLRLKMSLDAAVTAGYEEIYLLTHYPPTNDRMDSSGFTEIYKQYSGVKKVIYGHLHGSNSFNSSLKGIVDGVEYSLVSADYLDFVPTLINID